MHYPNVIKHNPVLDIRIPMAFLDTIQKRVSAPTNRRTHSKPLPVSHREWGLTNDAARSQSDFWVRQLLS